MEDYSGVPPQPPPTVPAPKQKVPQWVFIAVAVVAVIVAVWWSGRLDPWLSKVGLNKNTCVTNIFGATFCGDDAKRYQQRIRELTNP